MILAVTVHLNEESRNFCLLLMKYLLNNLTQKIH